MGTRTAHVHHWYIDPLRGETSMGHCACGASRSFSNREAEPSVSYRSSSQKKAATGVMGKGG